MKIKSTLATFTLALAGSLFTAKAQSYTDDFNGGNDANWTRWAPPPATATFGFPTISPGNPGYELAAAPGTASFFTTARVGSYVTGLSLADFVVSADLVTWAGTNELQMGVMARVQSPINNAGAFPAGYAFVYINRFSVRSNGTDQLRIVRIGAAEITFLNDGLGNQGQFNVVAGGSASPQPGRAGYRLIFTGKGYQLRGQIIDLSTGQFMTFNDGNGNLTDFVHATDPNSTFATGSAGMITVPNTLTPGVDTIFDNFAASGSSVIHLYPPAATNDVGTAHTVCAVITGVTNPIAGVSVAFNVTNGPNATVHGTSVTDSNGVACFTYVGVGGPGTDIIDVSSPDSPDLRLSTFATKFWVQSANQAPVAQCTNVVVSADATTCRGAGSVDNGSSDPDGDPITLVQNPPGPYPIGTNVVALIVTDSHGSSNSCTATVTVVDTTPPTITCPGNLVVTNAAGQCSAAASFVVSASDCSIANLFCDNPPGSIFPAGTTTVTCTAVDTAGNTNTCSFTVTVLDQEAPRVACRPAPNRSGKKIPGLGKNHSDGQNPNGYFQLLAQDNCDPHPVLYVHDTASSFIAGPFANGDIVKLMQNPGGTPKSNPGPPSAVAGIHLIGDGLLIAVDANGNVSPDPCLMRIPPDSK